MGFPVLDPVNLNELVSDLRTYIRDSEGLNTLLAGKVENKNYNLELAAKSGLSWFNAVTPYTSYTLKTLPGGAYIFVLHESIIETLTSAGILHSRNNLRYSSGGTVVNDHDQTSAYQGWMQVIQSLKQLRTMEKSFKMQMNANACYGGLASEFYDSRASMYIIP